MSVHEADHQRPGCPLAADAFGKMTVVCSRL
jgi:hypothetical protein